MQIRFLSGILPQVNIMLELGFLCFRMLVIVLEFIVPDECFTVGTVQCMVLGLDEKDVNEYFFS